MAFEDSLPDIDFSAEFADLTGELEFDMTPELLLDIAGHLRRLADNRQGRSFEWFDYHRTWRDGRPLEVVITDQFDPSSGEKYSRVIQRSDDVHPKGKLIEVSDEFVAPSSGRYLRDASTYLILKTASTWPLGLYGRPIPRLKNDEVDLLAGRDYNHYPTLPAIEPNDMSTLRHLQGLATLLGGLGTTTEEPYVIPGSGTF